MSGRFPYKTVFFNLKYLRYSTSSYMHLNQLAAFNPCVDPEDSLFMPLLPPILPEYLDKVCRDLMKALTMVRKDDSTFLFRPPVLVDQSQAKGLDCASEFQILKTS